MRLSVYVTAALWTIIPLAGFVKLRHGLLAIVVYLLFIVPQHLNRQHVSIRLKRLMIGASATFLSMFQTEN
jgi:hypothetical protein